jgi:flavin-dependent dehydrogenase
LSQSHDVVIIGAGPSGAVAATLLAKQGVDVLVLEKLEFPRFIIGESLLPQSMEFLEKAGMLDTIESAAFQHKNGAAFAWGELESLIDFSAKFSDGWATTYQVQRAEFDHILAQAASTAGATVKYNHEVMDVSFRDDVASLIVRNDDGVEDKITCKFVLDASGYGRVLPRLLNLELPSTFPLRHALFCHIKDQLHVKKFDRNKILITIHPEHSDIWYWLIPFSNGTSSIGVVVRPEKLADYQGTNSEKLWSLVNEVPALKMLLSDATEIRDVGELKGYSTNVTSLCSKNFALLGNAGEFLDPVFSSGVTIALKSADLVVAPLLRQLAGDTIDWDKEYAQPLKIGVECFKTFVQSWYTGELQKIILSSPPDDNEIKQMIVSILAGYAWDEKNSFVTQGRKYLEMVAAQC